MSNFTQDERPACSSSFVMNLMSCCSKSLGRAKNNMLSFVLPMFLLFSVSLLQAQKQQTDQERSIFYEVCLEQAPVGFTEEQVEEMVEAAFNCSKLQVTKTVVTDGDDCFWESFHSFEIVGFDECAGITDVIKYYYNGGDRTAPVLTGSIPPSIDNMDLCFDQIPPGPPAGFIATLFTDDCGTVNVVKTGEPTGDNCGWEVTYTYVIMDDCENVVEPEVKISYSGRDNSAPTLKPGLEIPEGATGLNQCFLDKEEGPSVEDIAALFQDNCSTITPANVTKESNSKGTDCKWLAVYTYTVTDDCDNVFGPFEIMYSGGDYENPVLEEAPANTTVACIDEISLPAPTLGWTDNCSGEGVVQGIPDFSGFSLPCEGGEVIIRWNYTDDCNNPAEERVQIITVSPAPQAEFPALQDEDILCENLADYVPQTVTVSNGVESGACVISAEVTGVPEAFDANCGSFVVNFTYTDNCDRVSTASYTVNVIDNTDPTIQAPLDFKAECDEEWSFGEPTFEDNCDENPTLEIVSTIENIDEDCYTGKVTRTWKVTDSCGNTATASQTVFIEDNTDPTITPGDELTVECDAEIVWTEPTFGDNCDENPTLEVVSTTENLDEGCYTGTVTRTWKVTDCAGNTATASQTANIVDNTDPTIQAPVDFKAECDEEWTFGEPTFADNCDANPTLEIVSTIENIDEDCYTGKVTRTWKVTDCAGNTATASQTVFIEDNTDPTITPGDALTVECDAEIVWTEPTFGDNCDENPTLEVVSTIDNLDEGCYTGTVTRTWKVTDCAGNTATASQTATIVDNTDPTIQVGGPITSECPDSWSFDEPTFADNCDDDPTLEVVSTEEDLDDCGLGTITRTWKVSDCAGNTATGSQTVTIIDETAPEINGVGDDFTVECSDEYEFSEPSASDLCDDAAGVGFNIDDWTVSEGFDGVVTVTESLITIVGGDDQSGFSDEASVIGLCPESGTYSFDWSFDATTDDFGAGFDIAFYINGEAFLLSDTNGPDVQSGSLSLNCQAGDTIGWGVFTPDSIDGVVTLEISNYNPTVSTVMLTSNDVEDLDDCGLGTITRTWTATDCAGNTSNASQTVTIEDTTAPEFVTVPQDLTQECDLDVPEDLATATDNCTTDEDITVTYLDYDTNTPWRAFESGDGSVDLTNTPDGFVATGSNTGTFGDTYLNVGFTTVKAVTLTFDFVYQNNDIFGGGFDDAVAIINGEVVASLIDSGAGEGEFVLQAGDQFALGILNPEDDCCGDASITVSNINFELTPLECPVKECFIREFTATDCAGNESYAQQIITLIDTTAPTLNEGAVLPEGESNMNLCYSQIPEGPTTDEIALLYTDNCGPVVVMKDVKKLGDDCDWAVMYTYTVKDVCDNALEPFKVYYNGGDTEGPTLNEGFEYPAPVTGLQCKDDEAIIEPKADDFSDYFGDNCSSAIIGEPVMAMTGDDCDWTVTYTLSVEDECGNPAEPIVVSYSGGDTIAPEYQGGLPLGENQLNLCFDETYEGLGEPTEAEVALLFTDNCLDEITAENITKIRKEYVDENNPNCSWIVVFEYYATDACTNSSEILKVNYQGGDTEAPTQEACVDELMTLKTENGAVCPADAGFSVAVGDAIQADDNTWTVAGIPLSQIGAGNGMVGCFSDNCTAPGDLVFVVTSIDTPDFGGVDVCTTRLSITFDVYDECGYLAYQAGDATDNVFTDFTCRFDVVDNTAPVIECPADVVDLGSNPDLSANGIPTAVATKLAAIDECQGEGEADYDANLDQISASVGQGGLTRIDFTCSNDNTFVFELSGFDSDGYATFSGYWTANNSYTYDVYYSLADGVFYVDEYIDGVYNYRPFSIQADGIYPSCETSAFTSLSGACTVTVDECTGSNSTESWSLTRTYFANDGCGNTSECVVTYEWTIESAPLDVNNSGDGSGTPFCDDNTTGANTSGPELGSSKALDFRAYPVPFDKEVTISYDFDYDTDVRIELYDTKGILIKDLSANRHSRGFTSKTKIDLSGMPNQMFYVKVTTNQGSVIKKIVSKSNRR